MSPSLASSPTSITPRQHYTSAPQPQHVHTSTYHLLCLIKHLMLASVSSSELCIITITTLYCPGGGTIRLTIRILEHWLAYLDFSGVWDLLLQSSGMLMLILLCVLSLGYNWKGGIFLSRSHNGRCTFALSVLSSLRALPPQ